MRVAEMRNRLRLSHEVKPLTPPRATFGCYYSQLPIRPVNAVADNLGSYSSS